MKSTASKIASDNLRVFAVLVEVARLNPMRVVGSVAALVVVALLEGISVVTLLPLLTVVLGKSGPDQHGINEVFENAITWTGFKPSLEAFLILLVVVVLLKTALNMVATLQIARAQADTIADLRTRLLRGFLNARWQYFVSQPTGKLANGLGLEAQRAGALYAELCDVLSSTFQVAVYAGAAVLVSWQVTASALAVGLLMFVVLHGLMKKARHASQQTTEVMSSFNTRLIDSLNGIKPLKAMGVVRRLEPLLNFEIEGLRVATTRALFLKQTLMAAQEAVRIVAIAVMIYVVIRFAGQPIEALAVITVLFMRTLTVIGGFQKGWYSVAISEVPYAHVKTMASTAEAQEEHGGGTRIPTLDRGIRFENVSFSYGDSDVLKSIDLHIPAGRFTCVLGSSGAGKTTLLDLAIGLIQPTAGRLLLDDQPLQEVDRDAWRHSIGYVPQEIFLFHDTLLCNVTLGDPALTATDAERALRSAGAWGFVEKLPDGINTIVGERGGRLSGGERQRISIARALVRNPKLLILDEATSALDMVTEAEIAGQLRMLTPAVTLLAITHRPTLVDHADTTLRIENGRLELRRADPLGVAI